MALKFTVTGMDQAIADLQRQAQEATAVAVRTGMQDILDVARAQWPVDSGGSRDAFTFTVEVGDTEISVRIVNTSGYAQFINRGQTLRVLVTEPFDRFLEDLPAEILKQIGAANG